MIRAALHCTGDEISCRHVHSASVYLTDYNTCYLFSLPFASHCPLLLLWPVVDHTNSESEKVMSISKLQ